MKVHVASIALWTAGVIGPFGQAQQYVISTYAGGGPLPLQAAGASLSIPSSGIGLTTDASGNVYFTSLDCVFKLGPDGIVTRIAGNGRRGYSGDGGPATNARFSMGQLVASPTYSGSLPPGLAVDNAGNVYVADNGNVRIRRISPDGLVVTVAGNGTFGFSGDDGPATSAQLSSVLGLAVDAAGNLLLTDSNNHRVRRISPDGTITTLAGNGVCGFSGDGGSAMNARLCNPAGIAMDRAGNLFLADISNNRIRWISQDGGVIGTAAGSGLSLPTHVAFDQFGNLLVVSYYGTLGEYLQAVWKVSPAGEPAVVAGGGCELPTAAYQPPDRKTAATTCLGDVLNTVVDSAGNLLVASPYERRVYRVFPDGSFAIAAGSGDYDFYGDGGPATAARATPGSMAVDRPGNVFLVDSDNYRIRKISADGVITTVAGNGVYGYSGDGGAATNASLSPTGVAVDEGGNLFIANNLGGIRKVSPDGIITTVIPGRGLAAIAADRAGDFFVSDYVNVRKLSPDGSTTAIRSPSYGLAMDIAGNLFFAEPFRVRRLSPDGSIVTVAGNGTKGFSGDGGPATEAQLDYAVGVAVDGAGNLFIADRDNNRIRKVSSEGIIITIAGNGAIDHTGDGGLATDAPISSPTSVAVDSAGNVYFNDTYNNLIRVLRRRL